MNFIDKYIQKLTFRDIFIAFSGVDASILNSCSKTEQNKYIGIGTIIFITAFYSALGAGYLIYLFSEESILISIFGGLSWGLLIFTLDRVLILSIDKSNIKSKLISSIPRLFFAILIAFVIFKPVELKIFENKIDEYILENKISNSFFGKVIALQELKKENPVAKQISLFLFLFFLLLEISPIIALLLSKGGAYGELIEKQNVKLSKDNSFNELELINDSKRKLEKLSSTDKIRVKIASGRIRDAIDDLFIIVESVNLPEEENRLLRIASRIKHIRNQIVHNAIEEDIANIELSKLYQSILELSYELEKNINKVG